MNIVPDLDLYESEFDLGSLVGHDEIVQALDTLEAVHLRLEQQHRAFVAVFEEGSCNPDAQESCNGCKGISKVNRAPVPGPSL